MATQTTARRSFSFLQIAITLQTLTIFLQAVSAGLLLTTSYGGPSARAAIRSALAAASRARNRAAAISGTPR